MTENPENLEMSEITGTRWWRVSMASEDQDISITLDVLVNDKGFADRSLRFFGLWEYPADKEVSPFVLSADGDVEWGSAFQSYFPVHGRHISKGERIPYLSWENRAHRDRKQVAYETTFKITAYRDHTH